MLEDQVEPTKKSISNWRKRSHSLNANSDGFFVAKPCEVLKWRMLVIAGKESLDWRNGSWNDSGILFNFVILVCLVDETAKSSSLKLMVVKKPFQYFL
jgi:hypothetical protein